MFVCSDREQHAAGASASKPERFELPEPSNSTRADTCSTFASFSARLAMGHLPSQSSNRPARFVLRQAFKGNLAQRADARGESAQKRMRRSRIIRMPV